MTVSDWGPDSPAEDAPDLGGPWEGRFVGDPGVVRPISAKPGEHFPPAEVDGYRLASANEATRVATYRAAADAEGLIPANASAAGATNTAPGHTDPGTVSGERADDLRAETVKLARLLDPTAFDDRAVPSNLGQSF